MKKMMKEYEVEEEEADEDEEVTQCKIQCQNPAKNR